MRWLALAPLLLLVSAAPPPEEKRLMVTSFDRIRVDGPFQIEVTTGQPSATIAGDPRTFEHIAIRVDGSTLVVSTGQLGWAKRAEEAPASARILLSAPSLRALAVNGGARVRIAEMRGSRVDIGLNGAGSIEVSALRAEDLNVTLIGTGAITLAGTALQARVRSSGAGSVEAEGLTANDAVLLSESSGNLRMRVRYTAQVNSTGIGGVAVLGTPKCRVTGAGPVDCPNR
jgi:hypothetical protein